jgi:hypothetical protein
MARPTPFSSARLPEEHKKVGRSKALDAVHVTEHVRRRAGGKVPGMKAGGRADHKRRSNTLPFSSTTHGVDEGRTTENLSRSPGDGFRGTKHHAGGHHQHKLHGKHGDHPGHHFQGGGAAGVPEMSTRGKGDYIGPPSTPSWGQDGASAQTVNMPPIAHYIDWPGRR